MRVQTTLLSLLVALTSAAQLDHGYGLRIRQDDLATTTDNSPQTTTTNPESSPSPTRAATTDTTKTSDEDPEPTSKSRPGDGDATVAITLSTNPLPTNMPNVTLPDEDQDKNKLPIQPVLTPGLGVAGAVLIIAGLGLGFVGVKHRATQTFISTSLLIALGIEVLVIYLMHPPVPNAVQGAYVVAGVVGGCLLGGLALIFKEVSEGFGCVLGGFCLAMWLLVLAPGGTIKNQTGRIILIGLFSAASFSLYISRFTRVYGMIGCTAFAGATAFILGVDCFSRAGLKEFWLYIWDLNEDAFPLYTESYPISRDMRAEIAAIVIVAFMGTMSQIKIWKIVKEQRAKHDADRLREQELRDAEEAELGRGIETQVAIDRSQWEGNYDGKKEPDVHVDSAMASTDNLTKRSYLDSLDVPTPNGGEKRYSFPTISFRPATRDANRLSLTKRKSTASMDFLDSPYKRSSAVPSLPPLSFGDDDEHHSTPAASIAATTPRTEPATPGLGISVADPLKDRRGVPIKRLSVASLAAMQAMEAAENSDAWTPAEEDDLASSVAATAADAPDMDALSVDLSRPLSLYTAYTSGNTPVQIKEEFIEDQDDEALCLPPKSPAIGSMSSRRLSRMSRTSGQSPSTASKADPIELLELKNRLPKRMSKAAANYRTGEWAKEVTRAEPVPIEEVPEHTLDAVQIEMEDAAEKARSQANNAAPAPPPPPPGPRMEKVEKKRISQLARPTSTAAITPVYAHSSKASEEDWTTPLAKRVSSNPNLVAAAAVPEGSARNVSAPLVEEPEIEVPARAVSSRMSMLPSRNTPTPNAFDERRDRMGASSRMSLLPALNMPGPNLLDERRERVDNRLTTTSFMVPTTGNTPLRTSIKPATTSSSESSRQDGSQEGGAKSSRTSVSEGDGRPTPINEKEEEDMTLAERKALVQQQAALAQQNASLAQMPLNARYSSQTPPNPHADMVSPLGMISPPKAARLSSGGPHAPIYDSHQPRRMSSHNSTKQAMNWSAWRNSNGYAGSGRNTYMKADNQMDMLRHVRMQTENEAKIREQQRAQIQEQIDAHMRMGGMHDAHRAAMARMQGKANKTVQ